MSEPKPDMPAETARRLMRGLDRATLSTSFEGWPYGSLVMVAATPEGHPLLLISDLAQHTANIKADSRVSLLYDGTAGLDEPLTGPRLTVLGRADMTAEEGPASRYRARHPAAAFFAGFKDFHLYRVAAEKAHLVAGFGRIVWLGAEDLLVPAEISAGLAEAEAGIVQHMNMDHADAIELYATRLLGRSAEGWQLTGIDPEGADLRRGGETARLGFSRRVGTAEEARAELVRLVREARGKAANLFIDY
jgi:heme iron utilization protein